MKTRKQNSVRKSSRRKGPRPSAIVKDEGQFSCFVNSLPGHAWIKDLDGRYVYCNAAALQDVPAFRGYFGKTDAEILPEEIAATYRANDLKVISERKPLEAVEPLRVDGKDRLMHVSKFPIFDNSGALVMVGGSSIDITAQAETEARFLQYELAVEGAVELIAIVDSEYRYTMANEALLAYRGVSREGLVGRFLWETLPKNEFRDVVKPKIDEALAGSTVKYETEVVYPTTGVRNLLASYLPIDLPDGTRRVVCILEDITERKKAEVDLREAEQHYRDIFENAGEGIFQTTPDGRFITANPALARMHGFASPEELMRERTNVSRDAYVDPSRREEFKRLLETHDVVQGFQFELAQRQGSTISVSVNARAVRDERGVVRYYEGTAQDITDRKAAEKALRESEERYRELFENSRDAIYVHDLRGVYTSVNRAAEKLSGFARDEIIGKHYSNFISPRHLKDARENFCRKLDVPSETTYESATVRKNGELIPVEVSSRLIHKDGQVVGVQGTVRDIRERKRAQEALQTYARRVIEVQEAERQNVARELHDEIGQILTAVLLNLHSVEKTCATEACMPSIKESLDVVEDALRRVRELSLELRPSLLDDLGLVAALRWYAERYTARSGIITEITGDADIGRVSHEIETACFRIIQEALTNTARHSRATRAALHIQRRDVNLYLSVTDDGIGFDSMQLLKGKPSAALGLHGMRERASAVNGVVNIESAPGKGTHLIVTVPLTT